MKLHTYNIEQRKKLQKSYIVKNTMDDGDYLYRSSVRFSDPAFSIQKDDYFQLVSVQYQNMFSQQG